MLRLCYQLTFAGWETGAWKGEVAPGAPRSTILLSGEDRTAEGQHGAGGAQGPGEIPRTQSCRELLEEAAFELGPLDHIPS